MSQSEYSQTPGRTSSLSRRGFIGGALVTAAAGAVPNASFAPAAETDAAARKIKLGVVGCGGRGAWIANLFRQHGGYEMHAVADYFPEVAESAGNALGVDKTRRFAGLSGYRRLIESGVEAVALETPPYFFPEHVQAAVEARLHIYMAKPVAIDVPGCLQIDAAAKRATADKRCFLVDYQMPTNPHNIECANRFRQGAIARLGMVKSVYYGGYPGDPPLTQNIEGRLRSGVWVNDVALGGSYHVNACIHAIQAMMWVLGKTPVAAAGISRVARAEPHGDSHDMFGITYEFADGMVWSHTGRHSTGSTGPEDPLATCDFLGDAFMRISYGGQALIRGGPKHYVGGKIDDLYTAGAVRNIASFHQQITEGNCANETARMGIDSCLATILGREACLRKGRLTMEELLKANCKLEVDLTGLRT